MTRLQPLVIAAVITILVILFTVFDGDAGKSLDPVRPNPTQLKNAYEYTDWCGGYVQISVDTGEVFIEGCDR